MSIFNGEGPSNRPLSGMLLKNTSSLTLDDGSLTVIDGDAYAGEALLARLKPGEERLISFAADLGTLVNVHDQDERRKPAFMVKTVNGVFQAHYHNTRAKLYTLINQTDRQRVVYIEHPIDEDNEWALSSETPKPETRTSKAYRFRVVLEPHQKLDLPVIETQERYDAYELAKISHAQVELFVASRFIDEKTRAVLEKLVDLRNKIGVTESRLQENAQEVSQISLDQQRLRENIKTLTSTAEAKQLIARYVAKANDQETRLEQIEKDRRALNDERAHLQSELDSVIRGFSLDRKLE